MMDTYYRQEAVEKLGLVTDRTETDAFLQNAKGTYNYEDLNRVENAVEALLEYLPELDMKTDLVTKTDWRITEDYSAGSWPTANQLKRYLQNVIDLCDMFNLSVNGLPAKMGRLTWQGANAIEEALELVYARIMGIISCFRYAGELYAGDDF